MSTKKLTPAKRELLTLLDYCGGVLRGAQLSVPTRSLASKAQSDGLVRWERPPGQQKARNLDDWLLRLTDAGKAALS